MSAVSFAYYCSGHGYGHATRVSAFASHLLSLDPQPTVHIISSAPKHVFADSIALGALYRYAEIDPVIVQPLAYRVDRQKSIDVLEAFLRLKDVKLAQEATWLVENAIDCVLSDTAFLGCLAANQASLPSVLVTNFSFDSVYSYLATALFDQSQDVSATTLKTPAISHTPELHHHVMNQLAPDVPISPAVLAPLVAQIQAGFQCADLLLLLPGAIPMPSFATEPGLPSPQWIDPHSLTFREDVVKQLAHLRKRHEPSPLHLSVPFPQTTNDSRLPASRKIQNPTRVRPRSVVPAPLLVRSPSTSPAHSPYTPAGRAHLLASIGIPPELHDPSTTKILIVSFGGQTFKPPRSGSRTPHDSRTGTPTRHAHKLSAGALTLSLSPLAASASGPGSLQAGELGATLALPRAPRRLVSPSHIFVPGAPPARSAPSSPAVAVMPAFNTIPPTPEAYVHERFPALLPPSASGLGVSVLGVEEGLDLEDAPQLLPDETWIAIVCGVPKDWGCGDGDEEGLPDGFYVAPKEVYMPDLTAVGDVLLGKLGYGTVSECVDACTPFVYVSRPLFVEEHGLRLLLERDGVGVELARTAYEDGDWADAVTDAWLKGRDGKARKRRDEALALEAEVKGAVGDAPVSGARRRMEEGRSMARGLVDWVDEWWAVASASDEAR